MNLTDGYQTIPDSGPFPGLDSSYETAWQGPWIGIDLRVKTRDTSSFTRRFETSLTFEYHWADYCAQADWNLREDLSHPKSFEHHADGNGWRIGAGFSWLLHHVWALNFSYDFQDWSTDSGYDNVLFADGGSAKTRLNGVSWTSHALSLGVSLRF